MSENNSAQKKLHDALDELMTEDLERYEAMLAQEKDAGGQASQPQDGRGSVHPFREGGGEAPLPQGSQGSVHPGREGGGQAPRAGKPRGKIIRFLSWAAAACLLFAAGYGMGQLNRDGFTLTPVKDTVTDNPPGNPTSPAPVPETTASPDLVPSARMNISESAGETANTSLPTTTGQTMLMAAPNRDNADELTEPNREDADALTDPNRENADELANLNRENADELADPNHEDADALAAAGNNPAEGEGIMEVFSASMAGREAVPGEEADQELIFENETAYVQDAEAQVLSDDEAVQEAVSEAEAFQEVVHESEALQEAEQETWALQEELAGGGAPAGPAQPRKLITTCSIDAETSDFEGSVSAVRNELAAAGGYVESSSLQDSSSDQNGTRSITCSLRVPAAEAEAFAEALGQIMHVTSRLTQTEDITPNYRDTESRLASYRSELSSLEELLEKAETVSDGLKIESAISDLHERIDSCEASLRTMDGQTDYTRVSLSITEVPNTAETSD